MPPTLPLLPREPRRVPLPEVASGELAALFACAGAVSWPDVSLLSSSCSNCWFSTATCFARSSFSFRCIFAFASATAIRTSADFMANESAIRAFETGSPETAVSTFFCGDSEEETAFCRSGTASELMLLSVAASLMGSEVMPAGASCAWAAVEAVEACAGPYK